MLESFEIILAKICYLERRQNIQHFNTRKYPGSSFSTTTSSAQLLQKGLIFLRGKFEINEFKAGVLNPEPTYSEWQTKTQTYLFTKTIFGARLDVRRKIMLIKQMWI